jgi:pimeloyl-ACP methyl ester carboxylesterase
MKKFSSVDVVKGMSGVLAALVMVLSQPVSAEEVTLRYQGLTLNGERVMAEGKQMSDGILLLTHGTLAHNKMEIIASLQELLADSEVSTLAINLSLGVDNRHGAYDCSVPHRHHHTDAIGEMSAWLDWLEGQGATQIDLMGHSRGGNQLAWLLAEEDRPSIRKGVLLAPATWSEEKASKGYQKRYNKPLSELYEQATALVAAGKPKQMMGPVGFIYCSDSQVTAEAVVSYYRPDSRLNTPDLLPKIAKPLLVVEGSKDSVVGRIAEQSAGLNPDQFQFLMIDGAGHFFRDLYLDEVVEQIVEWLQG